MINTYIYGAGKYGVLAALDCEQRGVKVAGFIDQDAEKIKTRLGLPVLNAPIKDSHVIIAVQNENAIKAITETLKSFEIEFEVFNSAQLQKQKFYSELLHLSMLGMNIGGGAGVENSGEKEVVKYIFNKMITEINLTIFDVGANIGKYSNMLYKIFSSFLPSAKKCNIYAFEPSKVTFMKMQENTKDIPNMQKLNFGLGSQNAELALFSNKDSSGLASVYNRKLEHFNINFEEKEKIQIKTIDDFCEEQKIEHINFLKLDVEGHELEVLNGAKKLLAKNAIDYIQFEFGGCNIDSRTYFQDFWYLLKDRYRIYRILRDGIFELKEYKEQYELFITTNFLAENKNSVLK